MDMGFSPFLLIKPGDTFVVGYIVEGLGEKVYNAINWSTIKAIWFIIEIKDLLCNIVQF